MKNPINKSNIRRPLKGILLLLLLLVISNTFISSISQFVIVKRETNRIGRFYKSIGTIQPLKPENQFVNKAKDIITGDSIIDYEDNRRFCQGIIEGLLNTDSKQYESGEPEISLYKNEDDYTTFLGNSIFIATVDFVGKSLSAETIYDGLAIIINTKELLAGFPEYYVDEGYKSIVIPARSLRTGDKIPYVNNDVIDDLLTLELGKQYLFRTYWDEGITWREYFFMKPLYPGGPLYEKVDDDGYIDWYDPKFSRVKEDIDVLNENIHSYSIRSTKDMAIIPEFQESLKQYYLKGGRILNLEDYMNQNHVCVINEILSRIRGINIGDKLEIKMRNTEKGYSYLATEKDRKEWKTYQTSEPLTFEVVGIFDSSREFDRQSLGRNIYIPDSTMPEEFGSYYSQGLDEPDLYSSSYSFTLKSSEDQSAFIEKYEDQLQELGYKLYFFETNSESFWDSAKSILQSSTIGFVLFAILLLLTISFVVYFYVEGHKLNYAIERTLGISARVSSIHMALPLIIAGGIFIIAGGYLGYSNAIKNSEKLLSDLAELSQIEINPGLSIKFFLIFILGVMVLFVLVLFIRLRQLKTKSIIELINSYGIKKRKEKMAVTEDINNTYEDNTVTELKHVRGLDLKDDPLLINESRKALRSYSINYNTRSIVSSALLILLAGVFVFSLLWMNYLIIRNSDFIDKAYNETIVAADIITQNEGMVVGTKRGPISGTHITNLLNTDLVKDYEAIAHMWYSDMYIYRDGTEEKYQIGEEYVDGWKVSAPSFEVMAGNKMYNTEGNPKLKDLYLMDGFTLEEFYKEYSVSVTDTTGAVPILASEKAMRDYNLELGDKISLVEESRDMLKVMVTIVGTFSDFDTTKLHEYLEHYTVTIGDEQSLFIYPISALESIERKRAYYSRLGFEFKPEKNKELLSRKDELRNMVIYNRNDVHRNELKLWDSGLINVVDPLEKNLSLLEVLYPVTFIVSILIAGILSFLMVLRRTLDVAILRVLGVKEKEVRFNLFRDNFGLTLLGIVVASIIAFAITTRTYPIPYIKYIYVIGGYLAGTIIGLVLAIHKITNKKPLDGLQVKE